MMWIFHPRGPFNWQGIGRNNFQLQDTQDIEWFRSSINSEVGLSCGPSWLLWGVVAATVAGDGNSCTSFFFISTGSG